MSEREYVLGTHDAEVERLGLQHAVWRARALAAWQRARIGPGQRVLDVGCGPGYATMDIAGMVAPDGEVFALDRSERFLAVARAQAQARGITRIRFQQQELNDPLVTEGAFDAAWCRWVFAFVRDPRALLARIGAVLTPGGRIVIHEYFDYGAWRLAADAPAFNDFVTAVIASWRASGGEPDIGLALPGWLEEDGFELLHTRTHIDVITPRDFIARWPLSFVRVNVSRQVELGYLTEDKAADVLHAIEAFETDEHARMVTPGLFEIIARRR
jgi:SAM-dependent methyltransferase